MMRTVPVPNYQLHEGDCKCGCHLGMSDTLVLALQAFVRSLERIHGAKIRHLVTSGARCKDHNAKVNGSPLSQHLTGDAADGYFEWQAPDGRWARLDPRDVGALALRSNLFGGVGWQRYLGTSDIVHLDVRPGKPVSW